MAKFSLSPKQALILFVTIATVLMAQAVWWVIFMARLVNEKVQMAIDLGANQAFVDMIHRQEISQMENGRFQGSVRKLQAVLRSLRYTLSATVAHTPQLDELEGLFGDED